jgi:hypothetical protein
MCVGPFYAPPARGSRGRARCGDKRIAPLLQFLALSFADGAGAPASLRC